MNPDAHLSHDPQRAATVKARLPATRLKNALALIGESSRIASSLRTTQFLCDDPDENPNMHSFRSGSLRIIQPKDSDNVILLTSSDVINIPFSFALSKISATPKRTFRSFSQYLKAFLKVFTPALASDPEFFDRLLGDVESAQIAVIEALEHHGYRIGETQADSSYLVYPPTQAFVGQDSMQKQFAIKPGPGSSVPGVRTVYIALLLLRDCYSCLITYGQYSLQNPMKVDTKSAENYLSSKIPVKGARRRKSVYPASKFNLVGRATHYPNMDCTIYRNTILQIMMQKPKGIYMATLLMVETGARISEPLALTIDDWVSRPKPGELKCPNKGSRGSRTKILRLAPSVLEALQAYVEGYRATLTGVSVNDLNRLSEKIANKKMLTSRQLEVLRQPLLISPTKKKITPSLYRDYYYRPALRKANIFGVSPHRLRHEHALLTLAQIYKDAKSPAERESMVEKYARRQGWDTGPDMVFYYTPQLEYFEDVEQFEIVQEKALRAESGHHPLLVAYDTTTTQAPDPLEQEMARMLERYS